MPANHFKVDGERVDSLDEFLRKEENGRWSNILYYPESLESTVREPLIFRNSIFSEISFKDTDIRNVRFIRCRFETCLFIGASLTDCEFVNCTFKSTNTSKLKIANCLLSPDDFRANFDLKADTNIAIDLYHSVYKNALEQHQPTYAVESFYQMKKAEYHHLHSQYRRGVLKRRNYLINKAKYAVHDFISGYGLRYGKVARFAFLVLMGFTVLNYLFRRAIFEEGVADGFVDVLYFTCVTVTTLGYGDIVPITPVGRVLVIVQTITGFTVLSIVFVAVANKALRGR